MSFFKFILCLGLFSALGHSARAGGLPTCDVRKFGATGNGTSKDTAAIQAAIDKCAQAGGGTVLLHDGVFLSGMLTLRSHLSFFIAPSATLKGTQDDADYPDTHPVTDNSQLNNCRKALLYAEKATDLRIEGGGTIDGNGNKPRWIGPNTFSPERTRPMAIYVVQSDHVLIQNLHVQDAAMWAVVNLETDDLTIRGLDIHTPLSGNRDGIDVVDGHRVRIENNRIYSEDDSICLKSGTRRGTEDVLVQNNTVLGSIVANGLKLGTASTGSFKNITFLDNEVENVDKAVMTVEAIDGAQVRNIVFKNIRFKNSGAGFFILLGQRKPGAKDGNAAPAAVGSIEGVHFENIHGDSMKHTWGSPISGTLLGGVRYAPKDITFKNVEVSFLGDTALKARPANPPEYLGQYPDPNLWGTLPASGLYIRHVDSLRIENSHFETLPAEPRPPVVEEDVTHLPNP
jgi:polygalacturonase